MRTFSEIIDTVVATVARPNLLPFIVMQANGIVRDLRTNHNSDYDLRELRLVAPHEMHNYPEHPAAHCVSPCGHAAMQWHICCGFRSMRAVRYDCCTFVKNRRPGLIQNDGRMHWYQSGDYIVFAGQPRYVDIAFYVQPRTYLYYDLKKRLIKSHDQCEWMIRANVDSEWEEYNPLLPGHVPMWEKQVDWVIREYYEVVANGTIAALFNSQGDLERGGRYHQMYLAGKEQIRRSHSAHLAAQI